MRNKILNHVLAAMKEDPSFLIESCIPDRYDAFRSNLEDIYAKKNFSAAFLSRYAAFFSRIVGDSDSATDEIFELIVSRENSIAELEAARS
jgi:hypothetical protein